jgi:hypothetical protein
MESIENINEYHSAMAGMIATTVSTVVNKQTDQSRAIMEWIIRFAYTQYRENKEPELTVDALLKEIEEMRLDKRSLPELTVLMSYYQAKAKMKPVQTNDGKAPLWNRLKGRL